MCDSVYKQLGLISEAEPECAAHAEGKNYFACLWKHGVLKTRLINTIYVDQVESLERLKTLNTDLLMNKSNFGLVGNSQGRNFMQLKKIRLKNDAAPAGEIDAVTIRQTKDAILGSLTPADFIAAVESGKITFLAPPLPSTVIVTDSQGASTTVTVISEPDAAQKREVPFRAALVKFNALQENKWANEFFVNAPYAVALDARLRTLAPEVEAEVKTLMPAVTSIVADPRLVAAAIEAQKAVADMVKPGLEALQSLSCNDD